jgi:hypothetical protein
MEYAKLIISPVGAGAAWLFHGYFLRLAKYPHLAESRITPENF